MARRDRTPTRSSTRPSTRYRRAEVLRHVITVADRRRDALLPTDVPGVAETFADDLDLLATLQLRWYTRLAARIESAHAAAPDDLGAATVGAWLTVADEMPGVRAVLDLARTRTDDPRLADAMGRAVAKERLLLAASAGRCGPHDLARGAELGRRLEDRARGQWAGPGAAPRSPAGDERGAVALLGRLRALLPA